MRRFAYRRRHRVRRHPAAAAGAGPEGLVRGRRRAAAWAAAVARGAGGEVEASTGRLAYVGETLRRVRAELEPERALIGSPAGPGRSRPTCWQGRGGEAARAEARAHGLRRPASGRGAGRHRSPRRRRATWPCRRGGRAGAADLRVLGRAAAGADVFERLVIRPHARIVQGAAGSWASTAPVIGFPRGAAPSAGRALRRGDRRPGGGAGHRRAAELGSAAAGRRWRSRARWIPQLLRAGGPALDARVDAAARAMGGRALHLQPRPRRAARHADRAHRRRWSSA